MNTLLRLSAALLCLTAASRLAAQTEVSAYEPGLTDDGITYFLPSTAFHVVVTARKTTYTPGELAPYAQHFLKTSVIQQPRDEWELLSVAIEPFGEADKAQAYTIRLKPRTSAPFVELAPDGRLLAINASAEPQGALTQPSVVQVPQAEVADYKTQEMLSAGSLQKMAELAADEIYDIRESRSLLAKGQADFMPKDGEQLKLMMESLDKQEAGLVKLFKGSEQAEVHTLTLDCRPAAAGETLLFRFSRHLGLLDADDLAGEPVFLSMQNLQALPAQQTPEKEKKPVEDLRYRVPGKASVRVYGAAKTYAAIELPVAQFGYVEHLGGDLFNKKFSTRVFLSPLTGGIVKIEGEAN